VSDAEELDHGADDLLRRALIDAESSAAVALSVGGLPVSDEVTVIFHGRRDLGTIQTYVAPGRHGAGESVGAAELLRVPCDLDLAEAEDRDAAERLYAEQARAMRDALVGADTVLEVWREPLTGMAGSDVAVAAVKSMLAAGNAAYDNFTKVTKQATEIAEANVAAASETVRGRAKAKKAA